jgi:hypothetical protein
MQAHPDIAVLRDRYDAVFNKPMGQATDGFLLLAGLYAAGSSWILGFAPLSSAAADGRAALTATNLIAGSAIAVLALALGTAYGRIHGVSFVVPLLGIWLIVSPWIITDLDRTTTMIWSNVIVGAVVLVLGAITTAMGTGRFAGMHRS